MPEFDVWCLVSVTARTADAAVQRVKDVLDPHDVHAIRLRHPEPEPADG